MLFNNVSKNKKGNNYYLLCYSTKGAINEPAR